MEEICVNSLPVHRLRQSSADRVSKKNSSVDRSHSMPPKLTHCRSRSSSPPASLSPPSTPSPRHPVIHPVSTSTASAPPPLYTSSLSHVSSHTSLCQLKPKPFCEEDEQLPPAQSDTSSPCPCHDASTRQSTVVEEVTIARTSVESVSLDQHLNHCNAGQGAAMQSFILDRFLPAAKAVAADHDRTLYSATKISHARMPSSIPYVSYLDLPKEYLSPHSIKSRVTPTLNGVAQSRPLYQDDSETESFNHEAPAKSCGSFCVGLKTALSRVHKVVHTSAHSVSRSKSRATPSSIQSIHGTSSNEEEDVIPKVKVLAQHGTWKQGSAYTPASVFYSSSSPRNAIVEGRASRYMANSRSGPLHHQSGCITPTRRPTPDTLDRSSSRQQPMNAHTLRYVLPCGNGGICPHWDHSKEAPGENSLEDRPLRNASRYTASGGFILDRASSKGCSPCRAVDGASGEIRLEGRPLCNAVKGASDQISLEGRPLCNAGQSIASGGFIQDPASRVRCHAIDNDALKDQDCSEDDEYEFHDALNRFDSSTSTPSDDATPMTCRSPESQKASGSPSKQITEEDGSIDASSYLKMPHAGVWSSKALGCDANHRGHSEALSGDLEEEGGASATHRVSCEPCAFTGSAHTTATKQKPGQARADRGFPRTMNSEYSLNPSSPIFKCQTTTLNGHEKYVSPRVLGWPLGITSFQAGTKKKASTLEHVKEDRCATSPNYLFTDSNMSSPPVSPHVSSPLVPPSPTGSWLGKAMALNASKLSTLATLQQREQSVSVRKKLEFTVLDAKKGVRWEDVVKGSQMHPEQFRLSEEIRHNHPSNRSAIKPLRL